MKRKMNASRLAILLVVVFLAIAVMANVFAGLLPQNVTQLDISSSKLYSISANTKAVISNLDQKIGIYWIVQAGQEDSVIENLLAKYDGLSDNIEVLKKDPDVYPTFAQKYTDDDVNNNDIVVEGHGKYRYISINDIYEVNGIDDTTGAENQVFDGEGEITSAIDYVVRDDMTQLYRLTGHGEGNLPEEFAKQLTKANIEVNDLALPSVDSVPSDCDVLLIYTPTSDISELESAMLRKYISGGGKLMVLSGPQEEESLDNLHEIHEYYGIKAKDGIVIESDRNRYAFGMPMVLLPELSSDSITDEMIKAEDNILVPIVQGLELSGKNSLGTVTTLLTSGANAINKSAGFALESYEKEPGDETGRFSLGVKIVEGDSEIIWISSSYMLVSEYNAYSSGANLDFVMNCLSELIGDSESIAIRAKTLNASYLTISESQARRLEIVMIAAVPLVFIAFGIVEVIQRRRMR